MKRSIYALLLALLVAPLVFAQVDKTASWTTPTQRVNGDALALSEIQGYDLECYRVGGENVYVTGVPGGDTSHATPEVFDAGEFQCRMRTLDTGGLVSEWNESNVFIVGRCDVTDCRPLPPSSIVIGLQ